MGAEASQLAAAGLEVELKFQVPEASRAALRRAVATRSARQVRLEAVYADTDDRALAAAGLALRLRREGRQWVQTLKGRGDGLAERLEQEIRLPRTAGTPTLQLARHDGTAVGAQLRQVLAGRGDEALQTVYRTDIQRTLRRVRLGVTTVEIALDEGFLLAGGERAEVFEIEFELLGGTPRGLAELAARWALRHGLWWDVRTKSERGHRLARATSGAAAGQAEIQDSVPAVSAVAVAFKRDASPAQALAAAVSAALQQALPNLAEIVSGNGAPEHLHQLRVALRRLRTVLRLFGGWAPGEVLCSEAHQLEAAWRAPFSALGLARDADVLAGGLWPRIEAAGAPPWRPHMPASGRSSDRAAVAPTPAQVLADPMVSSLLLGCLALSLELSSLPVTPVATAASSTEAPARSEESPRALRDAAAAVLAKAWKAVQRDARAFDEADVERRHRLRRRLKRLRYAYEALAPLYPGKAARRWLGAVRTALDALGALNDIAVAEDHARAQVEREPQAWFALGWLAAQHQLAVADCSAALAALRKAPRPWR